MTITQVLDLVRCPRCASAFDLADRAVRCGSGHSFDLARQGYLNLMDRAAPPNADTADMVAARSRFLGSGHFDPVSDTLADALRELRPTLDPPLRALEVGAGTGHYLARLLDAVGGRGVALDISVAASRRAAQAHARLGAVVADVWQPLPLVDHGFDVVLSVFGPRNPAEFARVLRPGGLLLVATPRPQHQVELRAALGLLEIEPDKDERLAATLDTTFRRTGSGECHYQLWLDRAAVADLVSMGPNAFHRTQDELDAQLAQLTWPQPVTVAVAISAWELR